MYDSRAADADIDNEIGEKEAEYIRKYQPALNSQLPKVENWGNFDTREINAREVLSALL